ncbi:hypothetical protein M422DRAFT_64970 [Sphaerobolus stellatus SS14]|nr:hypothetical protein M422DRAFT_64970 [Sphaerobolus stellatus SS14]
MEHVSHPPQPAFPDPDVLFLGLVYDGKGFMDYPERHGWFQISHNEIHYLLREDDLEGNDDYEAAFYQSWLYMGLLIEVLRAYDVVVDFKDFFRFEGNDIFITTEKLGKYLQDMIDNDETFNDEAEREGRLFYALAMLGKAFDFVKGAETQVHGFGRILSEEIVLSIMLLGKALQGALRFITERFIVLNEDNIPGATRKALEGFEHLASQFIRNRLLQANWCPSDISFMDSFMDVENAYYCSLLERKRTADHGTCTSDECLAYQIDDATYITRHIEEECTCEYIQVDVPVVIKILNDGGMPAIQISLSERNEVQELLVLDVWSDPRTEYIAISHVWSDGLGNVEANSLPKCQLLRLRTLCAALSETLMPDGKPSMIMPIWIDTLCVPLERKPRNLALRVMSETYRKARSVLVLDKELLDSSLNATRQEKILRISISAWSRRLWPLQESALARQVNFQFREGSFDPEEGRLTDKIDERALSWRTNALVMSLYYGRIRPMFKDGKQEPWEFVFLARALLFRRTSKREDETVCLSSIFELDVKPLLQHSSADLRMQEFYKGLTSIPTNALFLERPRLASPGFRWAPNTFLERKASLVNGWRGDAVEPALFDVPENGLKVKLPGVIIHLEKSKIHEVQQRFIFTFNGTYENSFIIELPDNEVHIEAFHGLSEFALITEDPKLVDLPLGFIGSISSDSSRDTLKLVESMGSLEISQRQGGKEPVIEPVTNESDETGILETIYVDYICPVTITPVKEMINWEGSRDRNGRNMPGKCIRTLLSDQIWCIR